MNNMTPKPPSAVVWLVRFVRMLTIRAEALWRHLGNEHVRHVKCAGALAELDRLATQIGIRYERSDNIMDIMTALIGNARISNGRRWLVTDDGMEFTVLCRPYQAKKNRCLYEGDDFGKALTILMAEDE